MPTSRWILSVATLAVAACAVAGTTVYRNESGISVSQTSPPGAVASEQVLVIENDSYGNQRVLRIGGSGGKVVIGPQPCRREAPTENMDCSGVDLREVQWQGASLSSGVFDGADLRGASLRDARLENASFNQARLDGADLGGAQLVNGSFSGASLSGARLAGAELVNAEFVDADLSGADLHGASLVNTGFFGADLRDADLRDASFVNTDFVAARLDGATWVNGQHCLAESNSMCRR